jgi:hypothetical protein
MRVQSNVRVQHNLAQRKDSVEGPPYPCLGLCYSAESSKVGAGAYVRILGSAPGQSHHNWDTKFKLSQVTEPDQISGPTFSPLKS